MIEVEEPCTCQSCGWLGDKTEVLSRAPDGAEQVASFRAILRAYRDICRDELMLEMLGPGSYEVNRSKQLIAGAEQEIVNLFLKTTELITRTLPRINGWVPWPVNWPPRYNGCNEPCDMLVGPCRCSAWHQEHEAEELLREHKTEIEQ